jgi:hypothetical protein
MGSQKCTQFLNITCFTQRPDDDPAESKHVANSTITINKQGVFDGFFPTLFYGFMNTSGWLSSSWENVLDIN